MTPTSDTPLYLIPLLPILGFLINLAFGKRLGKGFVGVVACLAVAGSWLASAFLAWQLLHNADWVTFRGSFLEQNWFSASELNPAYSIHINAGLMMDRLSATMCMVVTTCGFFIHLYSTAYMEHDEGFARYFAYLNLFTGMMLLLVLGDSLVVSFVGWEGVGLCSYLLIGFWFDKEYNAYAGRKAFVVNRIGDFGFLLGMFLLFAATSTLNYSDLGSPTMIAALKKPFLMHGASYATFASLLLFLGCTGKSAQLPLYVWLPDAMAGPTPVSALIHAATMVTAGVYMIARMHFVFEIDPFVGAVVAGVGALTALLAATIGSTQRPIKKILAYSTVSQLGFMFVGVGTRAYAGGIFHLVTHAFFKAGLFLGAGSVMHALAGEEDVTKMGGLKKIMPITRWTFLIYCLAISGIFPFAGFFSKDAILAGAFGFDFPAIRAWPHWYGHAVYGVLLFTAGLTAFYMFRAYFLTFEGKYRGDHHLWEHAHESPSAMTIPLIVFAIGATTIGFLGIPEIGEHFKGMDLFGEWLGALGVTHENEGTVAITLMIVATVSALVGIGVAWLLYLRRPSLPAIELAEIAGTPQPYRFIANKWYVDELYDLVVVRPLRGLARVSRWIDAFIIDGLCVRGSAVVVDAVGRLLRYVESGEVQRYLVGVVVGGALLLVGAAWWGPHEASAFTVQKTGLDVTVSAGGTVQGPTALQACKTDGTCPYQFDFGDGTPSTSQPSGMLSHHYGKPGRYEITVVARDLRWGTSHTDRKHVDVK